jgi:hypothetical protein
MKRPPPFYGTPFPEVKWNAADKPVIIVDGIKFPRVSLSRETHGELAYGVGLKDADIETIGKHLRVSALSLYEVRASSLAPLGKIATLRKLSVVWARKLESLSFLADCGRLETLILSDVGMIKSVEPVSRLDHLTHLEISGGIIAVAKFESLRPIADCKSLSSLSLSNIRVADDDLQFVTAIPNLKELDVSNQWPTEQYALLAKKLKGITCDHLKPWKKFEQSIHGKDVMVVGRGKPFLNSVNDTARIRNYEEQFRNFSNG